MPMYLTTHRYPEKESLTVVKEAADFFRQLPLKGDIEFVASYNFNGGCYIIWRAPSKEVLEKYLETTDTPTFRKNMEITEVVQSYPPTVDYTIRLWYWIYRLGGG